MGRGKAKETAPAANEEVAAAAADTAAAGAIEGAGAALDAGGEARDVAAAAIGGAAAGAAEAEEQAEPVQDGKPVEEAPAEAEVEVEAEDHITAFDRQLARLLRIAEEAEFESGSLVGDIRDGLIDVFKARPKPWSQMSEGEQRDLARNFEGVAKTFVRKTVVVIAQEDSQTIEGTLLANFTVKGDAIEAKIKIEHVDGESLLDLYRLSGAKVVIVSADDRRFVAQRRDAAVEPDQRPLEFESGGARAPTAEPEPEHPDDDSDLAASDLERYETRLNVETAMVEMFDPAVEGAPTISSVAATEAQLARAKAGEDWRDPPVPLFHVVTTEGDETLYLDVEQDAWTENVAVAGAWPQEEAEGLVGAHDAEKIVPKD